VSLAATTVDKDYDAQAITVLEGLEPVRKRPGMYIGSTGQRGLHHLVFEVVDNSVDEALAGHCTEVTVTLHNDGSVEVQDNGRGIPCSRHPTTGKSALETVLCVLHAGGKFGGEDSGYKVSGGLHGVGISVVNALSEALTVSVVRDGSLHSMRFAQGKALTDLEVAPAAGAPRGTTVRFKPDPLIFKTTVDFEFDKLAVRMDELAYLNAGLTLRLVDKRSKSQRDRHVLSRPQGDDEERPAAAAKGKVLIKADDEEADEAAAAVAEAADAVEERVEVYRHDGGIKELVAVLCEGKSNLHPEVDMITVSEERRGVGVEVALRWSEDHYAGTAPSRFPLKEHGVPSLLTPSPPFHVCRADALTSFANGIRTSDGGSHLDGLKTAVTRTINAAARKVRAFHHCRDACVPADNI